jgi:hypothetical protein
MSAQFAGEKSCLLNAVLAMAILALIGRVHLALYVTRHVPHSIVVFDPPCYVL